MSYYSKTYDSPNPIIRFAHRKRLEFALELIPSSGTICLLDYGSGDGLFLRELANRRNCHEGIFGFEPYLTPLSNIESKIFKDWSDVELQLKGENRATVVTCFEVLEHFSEDHQAEALRRMRGIMWSEGRAFISVPIEIGLPSVPKNLFRWVKYRRNQRAIYNLKNISKSVLGIEIVECRRGADYLSHMGFYFKNLERMFEECFDIVDRKFSPFPSLGPNCNSQVFYTLRPRSIW